jgi:hypothetical protein
MRILILLGVLFSISCGVAYADPIPVLIGDSHLIDGYHVHYDPSLIATWTSNPITVYENGTFTFRLQLDYLSENPTESKVYCPNCSESDTISATNLTLDSSIVLIRMNADYRYIQFGDWLHHPLTKVIPISAKSLGDDTAIAFYKGTYEQPIPQQGLALEKLTMNISWIRVFVDNHQNRFYQWMQAEPHNQRNEYCKTNIIPMNEPQNASGCFLVYYPIPEKFAKGNSTIGFDYVSWIKGIKSVVIAPPKQQLQDGVLPKDIACSDGYARIKSVTDKVVCVTPQTADILALRGWGQMYSSE